MGKTIIEKILSAHSGEPAAPGDIVDLGIDVRVARDFGGANVVKNLRDRGLGVADPSKTFFTFDCNPGGSDQKYATNQQVCRVFGREHGLRTYDIDQGIGTHVAIDEGLAVPGSTLVSTDSHANILGAIGAFGQGMGDLDIAHAFAFGRLWFKVPPTVKIVLRGAPGPRATAKDLILALLRQLGADGLLGFAAELYGPVVDELGLAGRITMASMATEMAGIITMFPPNREVLDHCHQASGRPVEAVLADADAVYQRTIELDVARLAPLAARPGHPEDVVEVASLGGTKIGSAFIGSCTNGRFEDLAAAAEILRGRHVAPGVVLKIVPATDRIWQRCLETGLLKIFKQAGALVANAGCAGCAAGQIGQNGPGEVTMSTGNRNFAGKQGKGDVYLASPEVVAASAVAGAIVLPDAIPPKPVLFASTPSTPTARPAGEPAERHAKPISLRGRAWVVRQDNIDTDMIFHNRHLAVTELAEMGQHAFGNLAGYEEFARKTQPGDIVVTGKNFGAGSSRQQAVDCFKSLGISVIVADSFGAIYERNAINAGFPILVAPGAAAQIEQGEEIVVDLATGSIRPARGSKIAGVPLSKVQIDIYQRGGLL
jgi:3-isopropylmalate/(R)-2-methylmalate dehydratase large subunit